MWNLFDFGRLEMEYNEFLLLETLFEFLKHKRCVGWWLKIFFHLFELKSMRKYSTIQDMQDLSRSSICAVNETLELDRRHWTEIGDANFKYALWTFKQ